MCGLIGSLVLGMLTTSLWASPQSVAPPAGQQVIDEAVPLPLTLETVQARRADVESATSLPDEIKTKLKQQLDRAAEFLGQKAEFEKRQSDLRAEIENGPNLIAELRTQLEQPAVTAEPQIAPELDLAALEQLRLADREQLSEVTAQLEAWENRSKARSERRPQMPAIIEAVRTQIEQTREALAAAAPADEDPLVTSAAKTEQQALLLKLRAELEFNRTEQLRYETLTDLFPLQRDLLTRNRVALERRQEQWNELLATARQRETQRQQAEAKLRLAEADPALRQLAERNTELTARRTQLQEQIRQWNTQLGEINRQLEDVDRRFSDITDQERFLGSSTVIGLALRGERAALPDPRKYQRLLRQTEEQIRDLHAERLQLKAERRPLGDIENHSDQLLGELSGSDASLDQLRSMAREYLTEKRSYLDSLLADHETGLDVLTKIHFDGGQLVSRIDAFEQYIDERVLWIRSVAPIGPGFPGKTLAAIHVLGQTTEWSGLVNYLLADIADQPILYLLVLAAILLLVLLATRQTSMIAQLQRAVGGPLNPGIPQSLMAIALSAVTALAIPILIGFVGWRLSRADSWLAIALGSAMNVCAVLLWVMGTFRRLCSSGGFAELLLEWPATVLQRLRRSLTWYIVAGIPLMFVFLTTGRLDESLAADELGRLAFILFCFLLAAILQQTIKPTGPVIAALVQAYPDSRIYQLRWLWYPLALAIPSYLGVLSIIGYEYTAEQLMIRFQLTIALAAGLAISYAMVTRWILATRRKLAVRQAQVRREAQLQAEPPVRSAEDILSPSALEAEASLVDLSHFSRQGLQLVGAAALVLFLSGSWAIWEQVLPALQVFSRMTVGSIPLGSLLSAIVVLVVTLLAGRNLPGLLEASVLERLPIDKGSRDAIKLASGYALIIGGILAASNLIGLQWNNIQWLAAALTVGLGFGLQEIFANFVSGIIILFERPVRLGDVVTIDNVSGTVTRIQIRATTITDWDRKEYIVPNKEFVTGKLLNWTLTDRTNRIQINVGVAYGSDVDRALELLRQVAQQHSAVLPDPAPVAAFERFGDSALELSLRCFLPSLEQRLKIVTELHQQIDKLFREAKIEIAFPQRDLHLRSLPAELTTALQMSQR